MATPGSPRLMVAMAAAILLASPVHGLDNGLGRLPAMGWVASLCICFHCNHFTARPLITRARAYFASLREPPVGPARNMPLPPNTPPKNSSHSSPHLSLPSECVSLPSECLSLPAEYLPNMLSSYLSLPTATTPGTILWEPSPRRTACKLLMPLSTGVSHSSVISRYL